MNDEQTKLARELAAHPRFEWCPGMAAREVSLSGNWQPGDYRWRITSGAPDLAAVTSEHDIHEAPYMPSAFERAVPDFTDDATGGALLGVLGAGWTCEHREAANGASVWHVYPRGYQEPPETHYGATLAEACARALLARWAREVTP